jgi:hypothetical protein
LDQIYRNFTLCSIALVQASERRNGIGSLRRTTVDDDHDRNRDAARRRRIASRSVIQYTSRSSGLVLARRAAGEGFVSIDICLSPGFICLGGTP